MAKSKGTKRNLLTSLLCILLSISMLVSSTFAWFTDTVKNTGNIIQSGNLDIEMYWTDDPATGIWNNVEEAAYNTIFSYENWEPGYTDVKYIKLVNKGNLALNYDLAIAPQGAVGKLAEVINVYFAVNDDKLNLRSDLDQLSCIGLLNNVMNGGSTASGTLLPAGTQSLFHASGEVIVTLAMQMITSAGNEYQNETSGDFTIKALATQAPWEKDSFGSDYDSQAEMPIALTASRITAPVTPTAEGTVGPEGLQLAGTSASAYLPAGVKLADGATEVTLTITPKASTDSGLSVVNEEVLLPVDIHIEGVAEDNNVPIVIDLGPVLPKHLNMGNYYLVHVEDSGNALMSYVANREQLNAHNQYTYNSATGDVSVCMASFSEATFVYDPANHWQGGVDYSWFVNPDSLTNSRRIYTITNADQLYGFSKLLGGMHIQDSEWTKHNIAYTEEDPTDGTKNTVLVDADGRNIIKWGFDGHTIQLVNDINLNTGNIPMDDEKTRVFYPIGYYNNTKDVDGPAPIIYDRTDGNVVGLQGVYSSVHGFRGTFNGNGHTISNFYQNTWDMFGDYNNGYSGTPNYYKDAMGLFGYLYGAEVRNLTVDKFSCDGEFTPTGVLAAYAAAATDTVDQPGAKEHDQGATTIAGVSITNCNPRVYNTGNGGVIGIGGNSTDRYSGDQGGSAATQNTQYPATTNCRIVFDGVTVDNTNKISALWGSWDVACGGIMGMFRGYSRVVLTNCSVAAQIDVFNDVCGNYQYYWYRYAGMMIGSMRGRNKTDAQGYTVPDMENIAAYGSTVHFGEWNNYYYCELVANSLASYTHDHQMSRLDEVQSVDVSAKTYVDLNGVKHSIPTSGRYNYVVVNKMPHATENATCFHFVDGVQHLHESQGKEIDPDTKEEVLKEDKQHIYLPFNQLFQGDGWGVKHIPIYDDGKNYYDGITILDREDYMSDIKFVSKYKTTQAAPMVIGLSGDATNPTTVNVSDLFSAVEGVSITQRRVVITMDKLIEGGANQNVSSWVKADTTNWTQGNIQFNEAGTYQITIQDYDYCKPTYLYVKVITPVAPSGCDHCANPNWKPWAPGALPAGHYYLLGNVTANQAIVAQGDLVIHLNGHNMAFPESEAFIVTGEGNTLSVMGSGNVDGYGASESGVIHVTEGADVNLYGGTYGYVDVAADADAVPAAAVLFAAEQGTNVMIKSAVKFMDDEVFLTSDAVLTLAGKFTNTNFPAGIELKNFALLDIEGKMDTASRISVIPSGIFTKKVNASNANAYAACFAVPDGYTDVRVEGGALHSEHNRLSAIVAAREKGAQIAQLNDTVPTGTCPMCGQPISGWERLDLSKGEAAAKYVTSGTAHVLLENQGTKANPAKVSNIIYAAQKDITMCVLVKGNNYVTGRFLLRPGNTMNVMGDGFVTSTGTQVDGTWGELGLFTLVGPNMTLNLYGGRYEYTGGYRRLQADGSRIEAPEYALINASDRKSTINIYQGAVIGDAESRSDDNYMLSSYGTVNMYGGTIRNGTSDTKLAGGNVTIRYNGVLNMYGGTITGGKTAFQGGNILLQNYSSMNMGYPGLTYNTTYPAPVVENGQSVHDKSKYDEVEPNEYGDKAVTNGGGNIATPNNSAYVTFTMHSGTVQNGTVIPEANGYGEYQGGGNLYIYGKYGVRANLNGGLITGGKAFSGGNIFARNGAEITIKDGMTVSNGQGYYYVMVDEEGKKVADPTQPVFGETASNTHGGNIDLFNYAKLYMEGGKVIGGAAYRGGNINVGHGALTSKPEAYIRGGEISGGKAGWGGNILVWTGDLNISGGTISNGAVRADVHPSSSNIAVSGSATAAQLADTAAIAAGKYTAMLNISGGTITGGIKVFQYHSGNTWYPMPQVTLSGTPTITEDAKGYGLHLCHMDNDGQVVADISGLTGGEIYVQLSAGKPGVFTTSVADAAAKVSIFKSANADYAIGTTSDNTALQWYKIVEPAS